jgi:hypothetical protein
MFVARQEHADGSGRDFVEPVPRARRHDETDADGHHTGRQRAGERHPPADVRSSSNAAKARLAVTGARDICVTRAGLRVTHSSRLIGLDHVTGSSVGSLSRFVVLARDAAIVTVVTFGGGSVTIVFTPRRAR